MKYLPLVFAIACLVSCTKKHTPAPYVPDTIPGDITTFAGGGKQLYVGSSGPDSLAALSYAYGVAVDGAGNVYIADQGNSVVRRVSATGIISTIGGNGVAGYSGDGGAATAGQLNSPTGIAVDGSGNVYIADANENVIRKINASGIISTIAGTGAAGYAGDGGPATAATFNSPAGIAVDGSGNVYVADMANERVRKINAQGIISTIAGNGFEIGGRAGYSGDGGPADSAELYKPSGVAVDGSGNVYIADFGNCRIRMVNAAGIISTFAGNGEEDGVYPDIKGEYGGDGGPAVIAELNYPQGVAVDGAGNVYIADTYNQRIRMVNAAGIIATIAGNGFGAGTGYGGESFPGNGGYSGDRGPATLAELNEPSGVAADGAGNVYVADDFNNRVRRVNKQ